VQTRAARDDRTGSGSQIRVLVYAPTETRAAWIETELAVESVMIQIGHSVEHVVSALVEDPPPRPQVLIADFDDLEPGELMHLHVLREQGWFGRIIALGDVPATLRSSLSIETVLRPPFVRSTLRDVIAASRYGTSTTKLPIL
jgi:hypothetical protein